MTETEIFEIIKEVVATICDKIIEYNREHGTKIVNCSVEKVNPNGTVAIRYNTRTYDNTKVLNGIPLSKGQVVMVCIPDNQIRKRFVLGKAI